ncbi:MAG: hypothetical protein IJC73_07545, partial [Lentisphaeria bacterium]|nr:hypothetical protein [Lentisphaeria bacterium]
MALGIKSRSGAVRAGMIFFFINILITIDMADLPHYSTVIQIFSDFSFGGKGESMLTGGATNRIPAVNAGGWSVSISHIQASTFAKTAADKSIHRDNLKPIWGCYCDNGANSINFEAATRPPSVARPRSRATNGSPRHFEAATRPIKASEAAATFRCPSYGPATRPPSVARTAVTRASSFAKATE